MSLSSTRHQIVGIIVAAQSYHIYRAANEGHKEWAGWLDGLSLNVKALIGTFNQEREP